MATSNINDKQFFRDDEQTTSRVSVRNSRETRNTHRARRKLLEEKLGRNDLCPCGSGKRFKRCCLQSWHF